MNQFKTSRAFEYGPGKEFTNRETANEFAKKEREAMLASNENVFDHSIDDDGLRLMVIITIIPNCEQLKSGLYLYGKGQKYDTKEIAIMEAEKEKERMLIDLQGLTQKWKVGYPTIKDEDNGLRVIIPIQCE